MTNEFNPAVFKTEKSSYTPDDFILWNANGILEITPKFQRRPVWRTPARSAFIDTLLRGMTVPPLYLRNRQDAEKKKQVREVVDGQQRVRSVLEFIDDGYRLSKTLKAPWAGKKFSQLSVDEQHRIQGFSFSTEIFKGIGDKEVLEVFCRLNRNGVPLNKQELRNGNFFGRFKDVAFELALTYLEFWRRHRVFTEMGIARMMEVELTSELLIAGIDGMQDKKKSIDDYYDNYEEVYPTSGRDEKRFHEVIGVISDTFSHDELANSQFRRPPLFYSLYCVIYHHFFGLKGIQRGTPRKRFTAGDKEALREAVVKLSNFVEASKEADSDVPKKYTGFVAACLRQTDNITPRKVRFNSLFDEIM